MKYYIQFQSRLIRAARFDFFASGAWVEDLPLVAVDFKNGEEIAACGKDALVYLGGSLNSIVVCNPFESLETMLSDFELLEVYIRWFQQHYLSSKITLVPPLVAVQLIGYERALIEVEKRAIKEVFIHAGAREVWLLEEEMKIDLNDLKKIKIKNLKNIVPPKPRIPNSIVTDWSNQSVVLTAFRCAEKP